jgi:hypothetical protein
MNQQYKQNEGLAMGAPMSAILAEVFMQHQEHNHIVNTGCGKLTSFFELSGLKEKGS